MQFHDTRQNRYTLIVKYQIKFSQRKLAAIENPLHCFQSVRPPLPFSSNKDSPLAQFNFYFSISPCNTGLFGIGFKLQLKSVFKMYNLPMSFITPEVFDISQNVSMVTAEIE